MAGISVSKSLTYAVVAPPAGIDVSKACVYAVAIPFVQGVTVTKAACYAVVAAQSAERVECFVIG